MLSQLKVLNEDISNGAYKSKTLPKRIKVLSWGKNETTDGDVYLNEKTVKVFNSIQKKTGRDEDVALDFDHCTVPGASEHVTGQPKSIAAYGDPELIEGDGLYLNNLEWTPLGKEKALNYKDLSPAVTIDKDDIVTGLHSVALTPNGSVYKLKFFSVDETMKFMSVEDKNMKTKNLNSKVEKEGLQIKEASDMGVFDSDEYNKGGANAGVKKVGEDYEVVTHPESANDKKEDDTDNHNDECLCAKCMSVANKKISAFSNKSMNTKTKTMSANNFRIPDAYRAQPWYNNTMNDTITNMTDDKKVKIKAMAVEAGLIKDGDGESERVLFAFLAHSLGLMTEPGELINHKSNTEEGGLKQFSAKFEALEKEIQSLKAENLKGVKNHTSFQKEQIIKQASKEGKIIPLSAKIIDMISVEDLQEVVANAPSGKVHMNSKLKVLNADENKKKLDVDELKAKMHQDTIANSLVK